ncbi:SAP domain-containing protein [Companilactobacillus keshanensis]|uniref:SAP domain-containing protein n=1 Tax=Companilactobacillus keshanensis TaxID=2486003 RepID=A0ABW4BU77_9LACO|nr:SAP domain-containing protein [Companilactobacillus keshanensis]
MTDKKLEDSIKSIQNHQTNVESFTEKYFYKTDLQKICSHLSLNTSGTKNDLNHRIIKYLMYTKQDESGEYHDRTLDSKITYSTKIIDGVKLNQELRDFMSTHYHMATFKFSKEMAVIIRDAKSKNDSSITIQTLIDIHDNKIKVNTDKDNVSYQWNQFVKDFCLDPKNKNIGNKLIVASNLWKIAKNKRKKIYTRELFKYLK